MKQKKRHSALEAVCSALISFLIIYPILNFLDGHIGVLTLSLILVATTSIKNYLVRRYFDHA